MSIEVLSRRKSESRFSTWKVDRTERQRQNPPSERTAVYRTRCLEADDRDPEGSTSRTAIAVEKRRLFSRELWCQGADGAWSVNCWSASQTGPHSDAGTRGKLPGPRLSLSLQQYAPG